MKLGRVIRCLKRVGSGCRSAIRNLRQYRLIEMANWRGATFSQFGEDVFLSNCFGNDRDSGFYVDVGAFHPFWFSNTHFFYRKGWRGINIEPNPESFAQFVAHRKRDINLNLAVSSTPGEVTFICHGNISGIDDRTYLFHGEDHPHARRIRVVAAPLASILGQHLPPTVQIDFMSIDCEGHDFEVVKSNDWSRFRPSWLLVEDHTPDKGTPLDLFLEEHGYLYYCRLGLTKVYVERTTAPGHL